MTEAVETTTTETEAKGPKPFESNPKLIHESLARFVTNASGVEVTPAQAQALLKFHSTWQKSPERKNERELELAQAAEEAEAAKVAKAEAAAIKKAEKEAEAAKKAAAKAAKGDDDSDLDDIDSDDDSAESTPKPSRRRRSAAAADDLGDDL